MKISIAKNRIIEQIGQVSKFDLFCFWFVTIDLLFLPYFTLVSVSYSVPIVVLWMIKHARIERKDREIAVIVLVAVLMILSTAIALVYWGEVRFDTSFSTSVKRLIQYIICFGYYFFYKDFFKKAKVDMNRIILAFIVFVTCFVLFFLVNPQLYANIKISISPVDNHTRRYLANEVHYRFNYWWTDPNNIAYLVAGLSWWGLTRKENSLVYKFIMGVLSIFIVASTASNGGLIMTAAMAGFVFLRWLIGLFKKGRVKISSVNFVICATLLLLCVMKITNMLEYILDIFIAKIQMRFQYYSSTGNLSGGRIDDLMTSVKYLNPLFLLIGSGKEGFTNENGHLYWICMYGFPAYLGFLWLIFRKRKWQRWVDYVWILPFFVCFTMNIGIGEFKWLGIYFMFLAYSRNHTSEIYKTI